MLRALRRSALRAAAAGLAVLLSGGAWVLTDADADLSPEADADAESASLVVAAAEPVLSGTDDEYRFTVLISAGVDEESDDLPAGTVRLSIGADALGSTAELAEFAETGGEPADLGEESADTGGDSAAPGDAAAEPGDAAARTIDVAEAEVARTAAGEERTVELTVPGDALPASLAAGVHGVRAEFVPSTEGREDGNGGDAESSSLIGTGSVVWRGVEGEAQVPLALVVPLMLPDDVATMPTRDDLAAAAPQLDELVTAAESWEATLAIDPRIVAGTRAYGSSAPAAARALLVRLESTALPTFLLQFADADPAAQAALGLDTLLQPTGLSYLTRLGTFDADADVDSESDATQDPESDPTTDDTADTDDSTDIDDTATDSDTTGAPALAELLAWNDTAPTAWPATGEADDATLQLLSRSGVTELVLDSSNLAAPSAARASLSGFTALVTDAELGTAARDALAAPTAAERAAGSAELVSRLALAATASSSGLVLGLDRGATADADDPAELIGLLAGLDWVSPARADALPIANAELRAGEVSDERLAVLSDRQDAAERIDALAPLLEDPDYLTEYQRVRLLSAFATRYASSADDLEAMDERFADRDAELLGGVEARPSENTQLVGAQSRVPVLIHNALPFDARVTLRVTPSNAAILVPERRFSDTVVTADGNATVLVPVNSRVSSGESTLVLEIAGAADETVFSSAILRLTIRSSYETIMLLGLGGAAALLLGFGVWRSVRRHRRPEERE